MIGEQVNLIRICEVVSVEDENDGLRIKVRLQPEENNVPESELPYCFPLLPKHLHVNPKKGECVLVILGVSNHIKSNRFFIGPLISQQYFLNKEDFNEARRLLNGPWEIRPLQKIEMNTNNKGSVPEREDIAIQGRNNADIILKDSEIRLRCGFKKSPGANGTINSLMFNKDDMAYIQMRYNTLPSKSSGNNYKSEINIVADRINLLSNKGKPKLDLQDNEQLINLETTEKIYKEAHPLLYGDLLIDWLKKLIIVLKEHVHDFPGNPPKFSDIQNNVLTETLENFLSQTIRIN